MKNNNIEVLRKSRGLTRPALASVVGVTDDTLYKWERGTRTPELRFVIKLADFFEVSLDYLLGRSSA